MGKKSWKETESLINESRFSFASSSTDPTPSQFLSFFLSFLSFPFEPRSRPCLEAVPRQNSRAIKSSKLRSNNRFSARFGANLEGGSAWSHVYTVEGRVAFTDAQGTLNLVHFLVSGWKRAASLELLGIVDGESLDRESSAFLLLTRPNSFLEGGF